MRSPDMETYKAIYLLSTFSELEIQNLEAFVSVMAKEYRPQVLDALDKLYMKRESLPISKDEAARLIGIPSKRLADVMNKLLVLIEDFCVIHSIHRSSDDFEKRRHLMLFLSNKKISSQYDFHYDKNLSAIRDIPAESPWEHLSRYRYLKSVSVHEKIENGRKLKIKLSDYVYHLDVFYCIERLKLYCENINRLGIKGKKELPEELDMVILISEKYKPKFPIVANYLRIAKILSGEEPSNARNFNSIYTWLINLEVTQTSHDEILTLCHYLINIALMGIGAHEKHMKQCLLDLITFMDEKSLLLERGSISSPIFKVAISVAIKNAQVPWAEKFFANYSEFVTGNNNHAVKHYCSAIISFAKKDYAESSRLISGIDYSDVDIYFVLNLKILELKLLIEENYKRNTFSDISYYGVFHNKARAFRLFVLSHTDIGTVKRKAALNFVKYLRMAIKRSQNIAKRREALQKLGGTEPIAEIEWLKSIYK